MADQTTPPAGSVLVIPPDTAQQFGSMVELIKGSESMNNEERQYWINILPIMTEEQLKNLEEILTSEKKQLADIDNKYANQTPSIPAGSSVSDIEEKIKLRKAKREEQERKNAEVEEKTEDDILSKIQSF